MKKLVAYLAVGSVIMAPAIVYAASYTSSYDVYNDKGFTGPTRSYVGSDIKIYTYNKSVTGTGSSNTITIELWRDGWINTHVGTAYHDRLSNSYTKFTGVGTGDYFFTFAKNNDGVRCYGSIDMYN